MTCTAGNHGAPPAATPTPTDRNLTLTYGANPLPPSSVTTVTWDWADASGLDASGTSAVKSHQYHQAGTFTIFATVNANVPSTPASIGSTTTARAVIIP